MTSTIDHVMPKVVFSRCLGFEHCRYDGNIINEPVVEGLKPFVEVETVCPEVEIGLGIPRDPIRLIGEEASPRLIQPETGRDLTETMKSFAGRRLAGLEAPDGFILKYASPSCGPREVKLYVNEKKTAAFSKTQGMFACAVAARFPHCALEDEGRLQNFDIRQHFLTRLFTFTRFRHARESGAMHDLATFHARHKLLLTAYNQTKMRELSRVVANPGQASGAEVFSAYADGLHLALAKAPRRTSAINVLMHALGHVSEALASEEKASFLDALDRYRKRRVPLSSPTSIIRAWIIRFDVAALAEQFYFEPFPQGLVEALDSVRGQTLN